MPESDGVEEEADGGAAVAADNSDVLTQEGGMRLVERKWTPP